MKKSDQNILHQQNMDEMEEQKPGIKAQISRYDDAELPRCPHCGSDNTAKVIFGIIGRSIYLAGATRKVKLLPNPPGPGKYYCNECTKYFD